MSLEKELKLPITFSQWEKFTKLQIHIPWTKLGSEPVEITINTLECNCSIEISRFIAQVTKEVKFPESIVDHSETQNEEFEKVLEGKEEFPPSGYVQVLVNRVINYVLNFVLTMLY
ncbi:hypothetical protein OS493_014910 [Desmophyllum pertusum]|uniref:Chorein N-terminal domain-containing protein n=1 Tax=Desmophyllum pertusum TaxID=174260 RepID=A0A9W9YF53_9CNID|nr:hypothetical protein OS493_014910 [Desmophyllum pertusum]